MKATTKSPKLLATVLATGLAGATALAARPAHAELTAAQAEAEMVKMLGFAPAFTKAFPANALPGIWTEVKEFELNRNTAIDGKTKGLIGLAIASQLPSRLATWSYSQCAKSSGATDAEIREAVMVSAMARHWSTFFNGIQLDEAKFRAEIAKLRENITKAMASGAKPPAPVEITDAKSVFKDVEQSFGFVPEFMKRFPPEALPGAWLNMRNVEMNPTTAISGKVKTLIGLAVSSQIPCRYCVIADTEFSKLEGATDREIAEAITMGAIARQHITLVEGLQVDEKTYRRDWERLTSGGGRKKAAAAPSNKTTTHVASTK
jgi:AhpD family alkylhydroperoxidase